MSEAWLESLLAKASQLSPHRNKIAVAVAAFTAAYYYRRSKLPKKQIATTTETGGKKKFALNKEFYKQLKELLVIVLPGVKSKEFLLLVLHTASLAVRTFLSIYVAKLDGALVKTLVDRNPKGFAYYLAFWLGVALPATYINSMIRFLESKLSIAFRTRLVNYAYDLYMKNQVYYSVSNLDSRLSNADQCLTEDVSRFCSFLAHLHSQISKPLLDILLITVQLYFSVRERAGGSSTIGPALLTIVVIYSTAQFLKLIQPPFGKLAATQAQLEGDLRFVHSRLITNAEEISFYRGHTIEQGVLQRAYLALVKHMNVIFWKRVPYNMFEGFFMKYVWSATGLLIIAIPSFFFEKRDGLENTGDAISTRTKDYITAKGLLSNAAEAIERIMLAFKEVSELAGYTARVHEMISVFKDVSGGKYFKRGVATEEGVDIRKQRGLVEEGDFVKFEDVPIVSPNGDVLVEKLSFEIKTGMHLLITGPNGCGKSSMFRILGGLWPTLGGRLTRPASGTMFYIPQRPYLSLGTLRDQVIYPDTEEDMKKKGFTDDDLLKILEWVNLVYIIQREGGWSSKNDWIDVLSGGEKQRMGMARLFYHKPRFAILDECTSAVSIDVEGKMYQHAIDLGITLLTVTHRPSLWKYHNHLLQFDGQGGYKFSELNAGERMTFKEEKTKLEAQLTGVPKMTERLQELCALLGEDSVVLKKDLAVENLTTEDEVVEDETKN
jgi:ATP-binding cassette subfamily D (ALD) protein 2